MGQALFFLMQWPDIQIKKGPAIFLESSNIGTLWILNCKSNKDFSLFLRGHVELPGENAFFILFGWSYFLPFCLVLLIWHFLKYISQDKINANDEKI